MQYRKTQFIQFRSTLYLPTERVPLQHPYSLHTSERDLRKSIYPSTYYDKNHDPERRALFESPDKQVEAGRSSCHVGSTGATLVLHAIQIDQSLRVHSKSVFRSGIIFRCM